MAKLVLGSVGNALEIAGSLCGVPYVGAAAIIVQEIAERCGEIAIQRRKAQRLADHCAQLILLLRDEAGTLDGSELQMAADEVENVLHRVRGKVLVWSRYSRIKAFISNNDIERGLEDCERDIQHAQTLFNTKAQITGNQMQRELKDIQASNHDELKELLHNILASSREMRQVVEMQASGEPAAEVIMAAGQHELRSMRNSFGVDGRAPDGGVRRNQTCDDNLYLQYQQSLMNLHKETGIPPSVKILNGEVTKIGELAIAGGTYSDVWLGTWLGSEKVALKALRNIKASDRRARQRFEHEIQVWSDLRSDHILPFYGIVTDLNQHIHMVSPWQENGNIREYLRSNPQAKRTHLLHGAAQGLEYLHQCNIVHGNMKCANILVSESEEARICDFGMSKIVEEVTELSASATLTAASESSRWLAPELIDGTITSPTIATDTYSFAMAILEFLTGAHPYVNLKRSVTVIHDKVVKRKIPARPDVSGLSDELWELMTECWKHSPEHRPSMTHVSAQISAIQGKYGP
ncbi:hypothetical protein HGRIS_013382 [Hohenbuehelia grisea]|uniref:Protein kinase domain-containing protein n=1 Tax=Hohenbuehelia grisea TaxID=104357 RepID=A0ABR3IVL5_9AGAR